MRHALQRLGRADERRVDAALAVAVGAAVAVEVATSSHLRGAPGWNLLALAAIAAPLAWRRRRALAAAAVSLAAAGLQSALLTPLAPLVTPLALVLLWPYSLAAHLRQRAALAGLVLSAAGGAALHELSPPATQDPGALVPATALAVAAWVGGRAVRDRRLHAHDLHERALALEDERRARERRAVAAERDRVARDLHDVVAHGMTAIALQAGAARRVWDADPGAGRAALTAIAEVARETLAHLRVLDPGDTRGLGDVGALADRARSTGLSVDVRVDGSRRPLPEALDLVAYRIVQEALTNAARHAAPADVAILIRYGERELAIEIADGGRRPGQAPPAPVAGAGLGLRGMRERVGACGGELIHGPRPDGGFAIRARLPLDRATA